MLYQCYVIPCYAMSRSFSFLSAPKSAILTSLFFVGFISPAPLHLPSTVPRCLLAPTTPYFFPKNCFIISAMLFNDLFNEFVQRFCSKMVSFFQEFSFVSKDFLFPSAMFNVRFQRLFSKTFLSHIFSIEFPKTLSKMTLMFPSVFKDLFQRVCSRSLTYCVMILFFTYFHIIFKLLKILFFIPWRTRQWSQLQGKVWKRAFHFCAKCLLALHPIFHPFASHP